MICYCCRNFISFTKLNLDLHHNTSSCIIMTNKMYKLDIDRQKDRVNPIQLFLLNYLVIWHESRLIWVWFWDSFLAARLNIIITVIHHVESIISHINHIRNYFDCQINVTLIMIPEIEPFPDHMTHKIKPGRNDSGSDVPMSPAPAYCQCPSQPHTCAPISSHTLTHCQLSEHPSR